MGVHRILAIVLCVGLAASCAKKNTNGGMGTGGGFAPFGTGGVVGTGGSNIVTGNPNAGNAAVGGNMIKPGTGGMVAGTGGMMGMGTGGMGTGGMGTGGMGTAGMGTAGMGMAGMGTAGMGMAGMGAAGSGGGGNSATGMLGGKAVMPIVAAFIIENSGETIVYLSTEPLTCAMMMTGGTPWLSSTMAGGQVIELVVGSLGKPIMTGKAIAVGLLAGEVNHAATGASSAGEVTAASGSITFTSYMMNGPAEGTFMATYGGGDSVMGSFKATACSGGQQY